MELLRAVTRNVVYQLGIDSDQEWLRDQSAYPRLAHILSTESALSTTPTLAEELPDLSKEQNLRQIGKGQCGTIFTRAHSGVILKVANYPIKVEQCWNDFQIHVRVYEAIRSHMRNLSVPKPYGWTQSDSKTWSPWQEAGLPSSLSDAMGGIMSERIFPLPKGTREALIDATCPMSLQESARRDVENKDCLLRVYMGRKGRPERYFKLRNLPLYIDDLIRLEMNVESFAKTMASALAVMHWVCGVDARDVEFVIGCTPTETRHITPEDIEGKTREEMLGFENMKCVNHTEHLWLLDFNECTSFTVDDSGAWLTQLVDAFNFNDPYYPRTSSDPVLEDLWQVFRCEYLTRSAEFHDGDEPQQFIEKVEGLKSLDGLF